MWYSSWDGVNTRIGYATSPDGIAWTKYAGNPVLDIGLPGSWDETIVINGASVVYDESVYHMWYLGADTSGVIRLGYATSPDRIVWTKYANNPVMDVGPPGTWDDTGILFEDVIFTDSLYQLWYTGWDSTNVRIGYATSLDGITWAKYAGNPVLDTGLPGSWEAGGVAYPSIIYDDDTYHLWYAGGEALIPGTPFFTLNPLPGYATSTDRINWTKYAGNPLSYDASDVGSGDVYYDGSTYHMWFSFCEWDGVECQFRIHYSTSVPGQVNLDSSLVAYYPFNGNANDQSGNGNHGTVNGATLTADRFGNLNSAFSFDGVDDDIGIPYSTDFDFSQGQQISFGLWVYPRSIPSNTSNIIGKDAPACQSFAYSLDVPSNNLHVRTGIHASGCWMSTSTTEILSLNEWHHIFATLDSNYLRLYINGLQVEEAQLNDVKWDTYVGNTYIGAWGGIVGGPLSEYFDGILDEVRIYDRPLSEGEIDALFNESVTSINSAHSNIPESFDLSQNYPNPFNPTTTIRYTLTSSQFVTLKVYNVLGQEIKTLINSNQTSGYKSVVWDGNNNFGQITSSGIYIYILKADNKIRIKKMLFLK